MTATRPSGTKNRVIGGFLLVRANCLSCVKLPRRREVPRSAASSTGVRSLSVATAALSSGLGRLRTRVDRRSASANESSCDGVLLTSPGGDALLYLGRPEWH